MEKLKKTLKKLLNESFNEEEFVGKILEVRNTIDSEDLREFDSIVESVLNESILDPTNKTRCKDVFDSNEKMLSKVRDQILKIIDDFKNIAEGEFKINNIYMIGSSTGFNYSETSDIDIEVLADMEPSVLKKNCNIIPKGILLDGTNKPINVFFIDNSNSFDPKKAENIYDILNDTWIKKTDKRNVKIPYSQVADLSRFFIAGCDFALSKFKRDAQEFIEYQGLDPETQEISEQEKAEALDRKIIDLKSDYDSLKLAHHIIFAFEKEGYEGFPFKVSIELEEKEDPRYSVNSMVYKYIDKFGYLKELDDAAKKANELIKSGERKV